LSGFVFVLGMPPMPLPLIFAAVPPIPELADVVPVSAADQERRLEVPEAEVPEQIPVSIWFPSAVRIALEPIPTAEVLPLPEAELLLPLAEASNAEPVVSAPQPSGSERSPAEINVDEEGAGPDPAETAPAETDPNETDSGETGSAEAAPAGSSPAETDNPPTETAPPLEGQRAIFLRANRQVFEPIRQIITATGDVLVQFGTGQIAADRLWLNLANRHVRAEGNVRFNRNNQVIEGDSATYNLLQGAGTLENGRGELQLSTLDTDFADPLSRQAQADGRPLEYALESEGTISDVTSTGRVAAATSDPTGLLGGQTDSIQRLRFESSQIYFDAEGWYADELRLTNDPFSPPQLEFRADNVRLTPLNEEEDELVFSAPRLVLDQWLTIPILRRRYVLKRGQLPPDAFNPLPTGIGIDGRDRDGLFVERELPIFVSGLWNVSVAPQFLVSRWLGNSGAGLFDPANFGLVAQATGPLGPRTTGTANLSLSGLDLDNLDNRLRASFRGQQRLGTHRLNMEYSYRDRLFNGSLGFQDVQNSLGMLLESPNIVLGDSGIRLTYQASGQYVTANTDQADLLSPGVGVGLASLFRFQGAADISRSFLLWRGQSLPATATEGLRYSDRPVVPNLTLNAGVRGVATYYTNDVLQETLEGRLSLSGQLGRLQRNTFDYTQFNIGFSRTFIGGELSPFLFDRTVDQVVLSGGITQQVYGPFLAGFQTSVNLETGLIIDTNLIFEYRRRAYGLLFTYNPQQETGFVGFRISAFDWDGRTAPLDAAPDVPSDVMVQ
jgi:hypothetical protein